MKETSRHVAANSVTQTRGLTAYCQKIGYIVSRWLRGSRLGGMERFTQWRLMTSPTKIHIHFN